MIVGTIVQTISAMLLPWVCGGQRVVAGLAPVADDRPDDQALDEEEDRDRDEEHDRVQVADLRALLGHRDRRVEARDDPLAPAPARSKPRTVAADDEDQHEHHDAADDRRSGRWRASWGSSTSSVLSGWRRAPGRRASTVNEHGAIDRPGRAAAMIPGARTSRCAARPRRCPPAPASCDDAADASLRTRRSIRWPPSRSRSAGCSALAAAGPVAGARPRAGGAADRRGRCCSAGRSSRFRRWPSPSPRGWWLLGGRPGQRRPPGATRVPRRRTVAFVAGHARARRSPSRLGHRALRHDAVLGPHGPARPADAGRGPAHRPGRARSPCSSASSRPSTRRRWILPVLHSRVAARPGLPGRRLGDLRGGHVGHPLLAAVRRGARGPARPRPRARAVPGAARCCSGGRRSRSTRRRGGWRHPGADRATCSCR